METIQSPSMIYEVASSVVRTVQTKFFRDGIEMEKGAVITKKRIEEIENFMNNGVNILLIIQIYIQMLLKEKILSLTCSTIRDYF